MKIKREDFKALIKECLIEILSEGGSAAPRSQMRAAVKESTRSESPPRVSQLPEGIPAPLRSLFSDSATRATEKMYEDTVQAEKQSAALRSMVGTFENIAFGGGMPLPTRASNPADHGGIPTPPPPGMAGYAPDMDANDDFDPYEAVKSALPRRR